MAKYLIYILLAFLTSLAFFFIDRADLRSINSIDLVLKDKRLLVRGTVTPHAPVIIVAVDHKSIVELGRWPWSREIMGQLVTGMAEYGVKVTALDTVFSEPQNETADRLLSESFARAGNVVAGYLYRDEKHPAPPEALGQTLTSKITQVQIDPGVTALPFLEYPGLEPNTAVIGHNARGFGFFNVVQDDDRLFRGVPLMMLYQGDLYPSLELQALQQFTGAEAHFSIGKSGVRSIQLGKAPIATSSGGILAVNYYGPQGSIKTYSAVDIIKKRISQGELKNTLAFVGFTEEGIYDLRPTPFDAALPGVEIHATAAANVLEQRAIRHNEKTILAERILIFLIPFLLALLLSGAPNSKTGFLIGTAMFILYPVGNYLLFRNFLIDLSLFPQLMAITLTTIFSETYRSVVVDRKGRYLKRAFSNYVSADLVAQIIKNPDSLKLGGEKREISILFSDIRGFTSMSEKLSPEQLVQALNEYLYPMTEIVLEEKGTLDKYIGDAVMAIYNAPLDVAAHAAHACRTALKMMAKLADINRTFMARNIQPIDIGIGINTGDAVVGNMGAAIRFDYTAIGDNVNLASRLEGLNKIYGTHIIVSESTRVLVKENLPFRLIDLVVVKGKQQPVPIYELMISENSTLMTRFAEALALYREGCFPAALPLFEELTASWQDPVSRMYIERCHDLITTPPPADWNGSYIMNTK